MAEFLNFRAVKLYRVRRDSLEQDYRALCRFNKIYVEWICDNFLGENFERRGGALPNLDRMRTFLRYVGDPGFQSVVAEDVGIDRTTVTKTISDVMAAILLKKKVWINFLLQGKKWNNKKTISKKNTDFLQPLELLTALKYLYASLLNI
ncbi:hypothetical protein J6590_092551 [Homalodisca vitripennis]|nr:hypothetical protein J6590_092551 [Homalodisca vitripennis]